LKNLRFTPDPASDNSSPVVLVGGGGAGGGGAAGGVGGPDGELVSVDPEFPPPQAPTDAATVPTPAIRNARREVIESLRVDAEVRLQNCYTHRRWQAVLKAAITIGDLKTTECRRIRSTKVGATDLRGD
jgi:hypothetical protein